MKHIILFFIAFSASGLPHPAQGQTLLGLPLADSIHMTTGTVAIAADDEDNDKLWSMFYRNAYHELWNLDPVLVSPEKDTIELPEWTTTFAVGSGFLFSTGNHGPGDPDTARHWLFIWNKHGHLLHQMPMYWHGLPYPWRPEGEIIAMCDMQYDPNPPNPVFDEGRKGSFFFTSFSHSSIFRATIYRDSIWADFWFCPHFPNGGVAGAFGLVHDRSYRGGVWLVSYVGYPPAHSPILIYPDTVTGSVVPQEIERPRIGEIWSMSGNVEDGLWVMGEWPPNDDYRCTAYLFRNPVSVDITLFRAEAPIPSLYPNPTNSWFVLSGLSNHEHKIIIYNLLGQAVYQVRVNGPGLRIEAPWPTGLYFVQVDDLPALKLQLLR